MHEQYNFVFFQIFTSLVVLECHFYRRQWHAKPDQELQSTVPTSCVAMVKYLHDYIRVLRGEVTWCLHVVHNILIKYWYLLESWDISGWAGVPILCTNTCKFSTALCLWEIYWRMSWHSFLTLGPYNHICFKKRDQRGMYCDVMGVTNWFPLGNTECPRKIWPLCIFIYFLFCSQNGCRRPIWMTENHFRSHFSPFQINTQLLFIFILFTKWLPAAITFDRIYCHFRTIRSFFYFSHKTLIFFTKWLPAAILDDRKSLLIAFLAISDQYATLI